jgi:polyhydroxyalkanoate synthesis regulator phasin
MRKLLIIPLFMLCFMASNSFAQMGHGMMREYGGGQGMMEHMMMHEGMMSREQTADSVTDIIRQLSELMHDLSGKIEVSPPEKLHDLRDIMKDMSDEMEAVSRIVEKGTATDEEVKEMRERIAKTRENIFEMDK